MPRTTEPVSKAADAPPILRLDQLAAMLGESKGASLAEMVVATGWQPHSVRGAMAGALRKRGHVIVSVKADGVRRYVIATA